MVKLVLDATGSCERDGQMGGLRLDEVIGSGKKDPLGDESFFIRNFLIAILTKPVLVEY